MAKLLVNLKRLSPTHHELSYSVDGEEREKLELETKSFLFHDLLHYSVETEAGLMHSFYGLLMTSKRYGEMSAAIPPDEGPTEIGVTERLVGALTGYLKGSTKPDEFITILENMFLAYGETLPEWFNVDFLKRIKERMRRLQGEWNALPFGDTMTLEFPTK